MSDFFSHTIGPLIGVILGQIFVYFLIRKNAPLASTNNSRETLMKEVEKLRAAGYIVHVDKEGLSAVARRHSKNSWRPLKHH